MLLIAKCTLLEESFIFSAVSQLRLEEFSETFIPDTPHTFSRKAVSFVANDK